MDLNQNGIPFRITLHSHCAECRKLNCTITPDDVTSCPMTFCVNNCGSRFHSCKSVEHKKVCQKEKVPCINKFYGCPVELARDKISEHLPICPASVIQCSREWNRWPMHSPDKGWKAPMPYKNPHVRCGQIDVALAMRDQRTLMDSFRTPVRTRKILRNPLNQQYPAVPVYTPNHASADMESSTSDTSLFSDDDTGTPWDLSQSPPGLQQAVRNQLLGASKQATESLTKALDYVTGTQGLKRLSEVARNQKLSDMQKQETEPQEEVQDNKLVGDNVHGANSMDAFAMNSSLQSHRDEVLGNGEDDLDVYVKEKKLYEVLGVDLSMNFISSYYVKPPKMFTFLCGLEFRRDEYPYHIQNFHTDIQCNIDNWFEQRCPLSYAGCTFSFQRFEPKTPKGFITHSSLLQSVGLRHDEELQPEVITSVKGMNFQDDDIRTEVGRKRLREATPEIHTSHNCESLVRVIPRYKSVSREVSPHPTLLKRQESLDCPLTSLPFEILQKIALHLDGFSMCNLSMTCHLMQNVCCSLLDQKGIVSLVWEKNVLRQTQDGSLNKPELGQSSAQIKSDLATRGPKVVDKIWNIAYKKWHFSVGFSPVKEWQFTRNSTGIISEHLKVCPYNQDQDKILHTEPYPLFEISKNWEEKPKKSKWPPRYVSQLNTQGFV